MAKKDLTNNEIDWLRDALKACLDEGRGWNYGDEAPEGGFATADEVGAHLAETVSRTVSRTPGDHTLHLWAVHTPCAEQPESSIIIANTGNGPRSEAHARLLAAAPGFLVRLLDERESLRLRLHEAWSRIAEMERLAGEEAVPL